MKPLHVAVMGAGLVGRKHIKTILSLPQAAQLAAVADPIADPATLELGGAAWFTDEQEMLDRVRPEAVIIATPNDLHARQGEMACARGIHFLVEKPVTATLDEAAALADESDRPRHGQGSFPRADAAGRERQPRRRVLPDDRAEAGRRRRAGGIGRARGIHARRAVRATCCLKRRDGQAIGNCASSPRR